MICIAQRQTFFRLFFFFFLNNNNSNRGNTTAVIPYHGQSGPAARSLSPPSSAPVSQVCVGFYRVSKLGTPQLYHGIIISYVLIRYDIMYCNRFHKSRILLRSEQRKCYCSITYSETRAYLPEVLTQLDAKS